MNWTDLLFYCTFVSQIFLISFYFPEMLIRRMDRVIESYPPEEYPKLYPRSLEHYKMEQRVFKILTRCTFGLGFVVLFAIYKFDKGTVGEEGFISAAWPAIYGLIQFIPLFLSALKMFSHGKHMRAANQTTVRKAELHRRTIFDAVSPIVLVSTVALFLAAGLLELYANGFVLDWKSSDRAVWLIISTLFMASVGAWSFYGRKQDPHQSTADRDREAKIALGSLCYASMALSIFYMTLALDKLFGWDALDATLVSAYLQVVVFLSFGRTLRNLPIEEINFDVYKKDTATVLNPESAGTVRPPLS